MLAHAIRVSERIHDPHQICPDANPVGTASPLWGVARDCAGQRSQAVICANGVHVRAPYRCAMAKAPPFSDGRLGIAANSRIADLDIASESANLARLNILQQAGTAMLAQANQSQQSVLRLLS